MDGGEEEKERERERNRVKPEKGIILPQMIRRFNVCRRIRNEEKRGEIRETKIANVFGAHALGGSKGAKLICQEDILRLLRKVLELGTRIRIRRREKLLDDAKGAVDQRVFDL